MKVGVIGGNGKVGRLVIKEAIKRNFDVTSIVRSENKSEATQVINKDIMSLEKDDIAGFDVIVDAFGIWDQTKFDMHTKTLLHLAELLKGSNTRLLVVGGAGSLYVDEDKTTRLLDTETFPKEYFDLAKAMSDSLDELKKVSDVDWLYISPASEFIADGEDKGKYTIGGEVFSVDGQGKSVISYADYAKAMVDEMENKKYSKERISLRW